MRIGQVIELGHLQEMAIEAVDHPCHRAGVDHHHSVADFLQEVDDTTIVVLAQDHHLQGVGREAHP